MLAVCRQEPARLGHRRSLLALGVASFVAAAAIPIATPQSFAQATSPGPGQISQAGKLTLAAGVDRTLESGTTDVFTVDAKAGQFLHLIVEQDGIDVVTTLVDPTGKTLLEANTPNGDWGREPAAVLCAETGTYTIRINAHFPKTPSGKYRIKLVALRHARPEDSVEIEAETKLFAATKLLFGSHAGYTLALEPLNQAAELWRSLKNGYERGLTLSAIGWDWNALGQREKAVAFFEEALPIRRAAGDPLGASSTLNNLASVYNDLGQKDKALSYYQQALQLRHDAGDNQGAVSTLNSIALIYNNLKEKDKALATLEQAITIARQAGDQASEGYTLQLIGFVYDLAGEKDKALSYYNQALTLERANGDSIGESQTLFNAGLIYNGLGQHDQALKYYNQALSIYDQSLAVAQQSGDSNNESDALKKIGAVYYDLGQKDKALDYYQRALVVERKIGDRRSEAYTLHSMAVVYYDLGQKQQALAVLEQAITIVQASGDRSSEAEDTMAAGTVYGDLGQKQKGIAYFERALRIAEQVADSDRERAAASAASQSVAQTASQPAAPQEIRQAGRLTLNAPVERALKSGQTDVFTVKAKAGEFLHVIALQKGVDVIVTITDPKGKLLIEADSPNQLEGPEPAATLCSRRGKYTVRIIAAPNQAPNGKYELRLVALRKAAPADSIEIQAENELSGAAKLINGGPKDRQTAVSMLSSDAQMWQTLGNGYEQALALTVAGTLDSLMGQKDKAIDFYLQALAVRQKMPDRQYEGLTLNIIAATYYAMGEKLKARTFYEQALPIWQTGDNRTMLTSTLNNLGLVCGDLQEQQQALTYFEQVLPLMRELKDRDGEGTALDNMGLVYDEIGQKGKALTLYEQALAIYRQTGYRSGEATAQVNMGTTYSTIGQDDKALTYFDQALTILRQLNDRGREAMTLGNIGAVYGESGQKEKGIAYYEEALEIVKSSGDRAIEVILLSNAAQLYSDIGQNDRALADFEEVLPITREIGDRNTEAHVLWNMGYLLAGEGKIEQAKADELGGLKIAIDIADPDLEGTIESILMREFRDQKQPGLAILFGKQAVNNFQQIRRNIGGLTKDLQAGFAESRSNTYRMLAELSVSQDQLGEAERVLDLLKLEELKETVRGAALDPNAKTAPVALNTAQQKAADQLAQPEALAIGLTAMSAEYDALQAKTNRTPDEEKRFQDLDVRIVASRAELRKFFEQTLYPELAAKTQDANAQVADVKRDVSELQNTLRRLGPGVVGVRTLVGDDHTYLIVVTTNAYAKHEVAIPSADLKRKILIVRFELRSPASHPQAHLQELYQLLIAPIEDDLKGAHVKTVLWSLDGVLRYLPVAALFDGKQYLVERFANVVVTPQSYVHLAAPPNQAPATALAMGLSKSYGGLPPLARGSDRTGCDCPRPIGARVAWTAGWPSAAERSVHASLT